MAARTDPSWSCGWVRSRSITGGNPNASAPRRPEAGGATIVAAVGQLVDDRDVRRGERHEQQLGDPVAGGGAERLLAEVDEHDADLATVVGVDQARAVDDRQAVPGREPRP